jgi:hypothetical protein
MNEGEEINKVYQFVCNKLLKNKQLSEKNYNDISDIVANNKIMIRQQKENESPNYTELEVNYFLCCFSTDADSLPMWNHYLKNDKYQGFALGFYDSEIHSIKKNYDLSLHYVIYDNHEKQKKISDYILEVLASKLNDIDKKKVIQNFLNKYRMIYKHQAFKSEQEVRAIITIPKDQTDNIKYEMKGGISKPFIEIEFDKKALAEVILSPALNRELGVKTMQEYLCKMKYDEPNVVSSTIPIRY